MKRRLTLTALLLAAFFVGSLLGQSGWFDAKAQTASKELNELPLEQLQELAEVFSIVKRSYVDEVSSDQLIEHALRGMVSSLDPHSSYLSKTDLEGFQKGLTSEEYGGVGIYIGKKDDWIEVVSPIYDSPAFRVGVDSGDLILKIDGTSTRGMEIEDAVNRMRGKIDTILRLDILPASGAPTTGDRVRQVELIRKTIVTPSVMSSLLSDGYGYLRVTRFQDKTSSDFVKNLNGMYEKNGAPLRGIVLDLRHNPGGYLDAGIQVAASFLPNGVTVVSDQGRSRQTKVFVASKSGYLQDLKNAKALLTVPMVVLVNNGSASASEIVAGALQDHHRAIIMGRRTYGKASVQTVQPLQSSKGKTALRLTMARYFTPLGRNIQGRGIMPDIPVNEAKNIEEKEEGFALREEDIAGHLENTENTTGDEAEAQETDGQPERPAFIADNDFQYEQAMLVLKALAITADKK